MIRRRLREAELAAAAGTLDAGKTLTDAVGTISSIDADVIHLDTRQGAVQVARADVVTAKVLGPRPTRRGAPHRAVSVTDLEALMVEGWPPHEREWRGRWMLRAAGGYTGRANSALVLGDADLPTGDALADVERWYALRGLPPLLQLPLAPGFSPDDDALIVEARASGWEARSRVRVMTAASAEVAMVAGTAPAFPEPTTTLEVSSHLTDMWWSLADDRTLAAEDAARRVMTGSDDQRFLTLTTPTDATDGASTPPTGDSASAVAHVRLTLAPGWAGVSALATARASQRQGHARRLLGAGADLALKNGAPSMYLQVAEANTAAVALYESLGFTTHHTYVYLSPAHERRRH